MFPSCLLNISRILLVISYPHHISRLARDERSLHASNDRLHAKILRNLVDLAARVLITLPLRRAQLHALMAEASGSDTNGLIHRIHEGKKHCTPLFWTQLTSMRNHAKQRQKNHLPTKQILHSGRSLTKLPHWSLIFPKSVKGDRRMRRAVVAQLLWTYRPRTSTAASQKGRLSPQYKTTWCWSHFRSMDVRHVDMRVFPTGAAL